MRAVVVVALACVGTTAAAHHEAIFGPQSSLVLTAPGFVTVQGFSKRTGAGDQETTFIGAFGMSPGSRPEFSFGLTVPLSWIDSSNRADSSKVGLENVVVGTRYRLDLRRLQQRFRKDGNFVLFMAAFEIPNGTIDYPHPFQGTYNALTATLYALEWRMFSANAFLLYRYDGVDSTRSKKGDEIFAGLGFAWTPIDRPNRLLSFQVGVSAENHLRRQLLGAEVAESGGTEVMISPTIVFMPTGRWQIFALASLPAYQGLRDPSEQDRWRIGLGLIYLFHGAGDAVTRSLVARAPTRSRP